MLWFHFPGLHLGSFGAKGASGGSCSWLTCLLRGDVARLAWLTLERWRLQGGPFSSSEQSGSKAEHPSATSPGLGGRAGQCRPSVASGSAPGLEDGALAPAFVSVLLKPPGTAPSVNSLNPALLVLRSAVRAEVCASRRASACGPRSGSVTVLRAGMGRGAGAGLLASFS